MSCNLFFKNFGRFSIFGDFNIFFGEKHAFFRNLTRKTPFLGYNCFLTDFYTVFQHFTCNLICNRQIFMPLCYLLFICLFFSNKAFIFVKSNKEGYSSNNS